MYDFTDSSNAELLNQAAVLADEGQLREARSLVKQAIRNDSRDIEAWWALTQLATSDTERNQALKEVLLRDPHHPHALHLRDQIRAGSVPSLDIRTYPQPEYRKNPKYQMDASYMRRKDYLASAFGVLLAYLFFWLAGLGLNIYFLYEARRLEQETGVKQHNVGCLQSLLTVFVAVPFAIVALLVVMTMLSGN